VKSALEIRGDLPFYVASPQLWGFVGGHIISLVAIVGRGATAVVPEYFQQLSYFFRNLAKQIQEPL
jgi:hypothetical protein